MFLTNPGRYIGNDRQNNRLMVGGTVYQYPTPVNVMNAGSNNPQQYDTYPDSGRDYYSKRIINILRKEIFLLDNMNDMRLSSSGGWHSALSFCKISMDTNFFEYSILCERLTHYYFTINRFYFVIIYSTG